MRTEKVTSFMYRPLHLCVIMIAGLAFCSLIIPPQARSQAAPSRCDSTSICPGEDLLYEVSWMGIALGRIRIQTYPSTIVNGSVIHHASAVINSYDGLPFVDVHAVDSTEMDGHLYSGTYRNFEKKSNGWFSELLTVDSLWRHVIIESYHSAEMGSPPLGAPHYDTISLSGKPMENGLSILFFAREEVRKSRKGESGAGELVREDDGPKGLKRGLSVQTVVYGKKGMTKFLFGTVPEYTEIDAYKDRKIRVVPFEGKAEFKGLFGLTGDFRGWCTDDNASIPVRAELQVLIGSVKAELIHWKRPGWTPPE